MRFSARRRARNRRRLKRSLGISEGALTNTCSIPGSVASARSPQADGSTGTVRQPATSSSTRAISSLIIARAASAVRLSWLRNTLPAAKRSLISKPHSSPTARKNPVGDFISSPQPSPVLPSAATAPRCVRRARAEIAVLTTQWLGKSSRLAIRPKPQLSRSNAGSYRFFTFRSVMRAIGNAPSAPFVNRSH